MSVYGCCTVPPICSAACVLSLVTNTIVFNSSPTPCLALLAATRLLDSPPGGLEEIEDEDGDEDEDDGIESPKSS